MVNKWKVRQRVILSWFHTMAAVAVLAVLLGVVAFISVRFGGFRLVYRMVLAIFAVSVITFLLSEMIANLILRAKKPEWNRHQNFIQGMEELCRNVGWIFQPRPRLYIVEMGGPNAVAYGWGFLGQYAVGITQSLYDMLTPRELKAVLAHELAHIRCKDVGLMTVVSILSGGGTWLALWLFRGGFGPAGFVFGAMIWVLARFVFPVGTSAISQQREYSADALGVLYTGDVEALKSALQKISGPMALTGSQVILRDLFISHPAFGDRLEALGRLTHNPLLGRENLT